MRSDAVGIQAQHLRSRGAPARRRGSSTLQTPPSTYSRSPIRTGAKTHGIAHDAVTASATLARGAPGAPKTTRRPVRRSTQHTRRRPSKRAPERSTLVVQAAERAPGARRAREQGRAHQRAAGRRERGGHGRQRRAWPPSPSAPRVRTRPRRRPSASGGVAALPTRPRRGGRRSGLPAARRAATIEPAEVPTKDSTPRKSTPAVLDAGEHARHPGLADHAAGGEDEHVGCDDAGHSRHA